MAAEKYELGGTVPEADENTGITDIPQTITLLADKFTSNAPGKPEVIKGLTNIEEVFGFFRPNTIIGFENDCGGLQNETLYFSKLDDFGVNGLMQQSLILSDLNKKYQEYKKINRQLRNNKLLKQALSQQESKTALLNALQAMITEMEAGN
jgi:hypothetical protein